MRFILLFIFISRLSFSQDLQSFLSYAVFNTEDGPFLETYLSFDANTLVMKNIDDSFFGEIDIEIIIYENQKIIFNDHYLLQSPLFSSATKNDIFFIDQQRIKLNNGKYLLNIKLFDKNNKSIITYSEDINIYYDKNISISDIQLIDKFSDVQRENITDNILYKSGYKLYPFISNFYSQNINELIYYFEVYNTNLLEENKYIINTYIANHKTKTALFNYNKVLRKNSSDITSNLLKFNIERLPTGNYDLVCLIKDSQNKSIVKKELFFQRSNQLNTVDNEHDINSISIKGSFVESIINKDILREYIDYLYPISTPQENIFAQNQLKYNDLQLMQKFFYNFWKSRNNINPADEWNKYLIEVLKVNKEFKNNNILGYQTDRGRVYLQYGPPNNRNKVKNTSSSYPYEIWHYYKLNNQTDKKFVFINSDFATNEYRLEYSNVNGEVSNSEWRDNIEQNINPTFGDDFNNNYMNPR